MIEMTIVAHSAAEIHVIADALQRIASIRLQEEIPQSEQAPIVPVADTVTLVEPAPAEAPKRRGRPAKSETPEPAPAPAPAAEPEPAPAPAAEPVAEFEPGPAPVLTLEEVRAKAAAVSQAGKAAAVKDLLVKFNAARLTDLPPAKYPAFLSHLEAV